MEEGSSRLWATLAVLGVAGILAVAVLRQRAEVPPPVAPEPASDTSTPAAPAADEGPRYPVAPTVSERAARELVPLPDLADSDQYFLLALVDLFGPGVEGMLADPALIEKIVATVDGLPTPQVAERVRPIKGVDDPLLVDGQDGSGEYLLNTASYRRYDLLVNLIATADVAELAGAYQRFYPLFQQAYVNLGYPDGYFNDRLIEVVDHLLATPDIPEPPTLVRPHVLYEFADPDVEARSSGQKLLLRIGPDHRARVFHFLEAFREAIATLGVPSAAND